MQYFETLGFRREPFSNSPDPEMFYQSAQHVGCLQKLEIAIRLRRGLSVVIGEVGTGKSTLCRRLIQRLHAGGGAVAAHLILDPEYASPQEFLTAVHKTLAVPGTVPAGASPSHLKDRIEHHLFGQAVEGGKIPVLIIDEGQKLPAFAVEILRELLNYETNQHKLLQIIIFAQREFEAVIKARPNFADRITSLHRLGPLSLADTRKMIRFRLAQAAADPHQPPRLLTPTALIAVHLLTGGYPRKIVMLCSKVMMAAIVADRRNAGVAMVLRSARETTLGLKKRRRPLAWGVAIAACAAAVFLLPRHPLPPPPVPAVPAVTTIHPSAGTPTTAPPAITTPTPAVIKAPAVPVRNEGVLGTLIMTKGDNLSKMIARVYGRFYEARLARVLAANPQIDDSDNVAVGTKIRLPILTDALPASGHFIVRLATEKTLAAAYDFVRAYPAAEAPLRIIPAAGGGFTICLDREFSTRAAADRAAAALPAPYRAAGINPM